MGMLPTIQRQALWRPDLYEEPTCMACQSAPETIEHLLNCPSTVIPVDQLQTRIREELASVLPTNKVRHAQLLAHLVLQAGLQVEGFRGILPPVVRLSLSQAPIEMPTDTACLAVLRALFRVVYHDIWKKRCQATIARERVLGITPSMKRLPPADRRQVARPDPDPEVPAVLHGRPHPPSPSFNQSRAVRSSLFQRASRIFLRVNP